MKRLILLLAIAGCISNCPAQAVFEKSYHLPALYYPQCMIQCADGGFLIGEFVFLGSLLIRTDSAGQLLWAEKIQPADTLQPLRIIDLAECANGYYVLAHSFGPAASDALIVQKLDVNGNPQWEKQYAGTDNSYDHSKIRTTDEGGFLISESSYTHMGAIRCNALGAVLWARSYSADTTSPFPKNPSFDCHIMNDGSIFFTGKSSSAICLLKTDPAGLVQWSRVYGDSHAYYHANSISESGDGGYLIAGYQDSMGFAMQTDAFGAITWYHTYSLALYFEQVCRLGNGNFVLSGHSSTYKPILVTIDPNGVVLGTKVIDSYASVTSGNYRAILAATSDGGYATTTLFLDVSGGMAVLFKPDVLDSLPCDFFTSLPVAVAGTTFPDTINIPFFSWNEPVTPAAYPLLVTNVYLPVSNFCYLIGEEEMRMQTATVSVFPSPVVAGEQVQLRVTSAEGNARLAIYDVNGKRMQETEQRVTNAGGELIEIGTENFSPGIYFARLTNEKDELLATEKFIVR